MLKNEPTLAIVGVDTADNEPCKVCPLSVYRSPRFAPEYPVLVGALRKAREVVPSALVQRRTCCDTIDHFGKTKQNK